MAREASDVPSGLSAFYPILPILKDWAIVAQPSGMRNKA